jgi:hypothetical protein
MVLLEPWFLILFQKLIIFDCQKYLIITEYDSQNCELEWGYDIKFIAT